MSVKYRKISTRFWCDAKVMSLSDDGQLLFLFVLTHPQMTSVGAMRASVSGLASEKRWELERAAKGFGELFRNGMAEYDESTSSLVLPNFIKHNPPENINVVKAWRKAFDELPESKLITQHYQRVRVFLKLYHEPYMELFNEPFRNGMPIQEQEQEQEQEQSLSPAEVGKNYRDKVRAQNQRMALGSICHFGRFRELYPKPGNWLEAELAWRQQKCDEVAEIIFADVPKRQAEDAHWQEKRFIPNPENYLKREVWKNAIVPKPTQNTNGSAFSGKSIAQLKRERAEREAAEAAQQGVDRSDIRTVTGSFSNVASK